MHQKQRTIERTVHLVGIGLHSGLTARLTLSPAPEDSGILFRRSDLDTPQYRSPSIRAHFSEISETKFATTLGLGVNRIQTVEHLLAAFQLLDLHNIGVEVNGPEIPILDGSAHVFCEALTSAGIQIQNAARPEIRLRKTIEVELPCGKKARVEPSNELQIESTMVWDHPGLQQEQHFSYRANQTQVFELARARTFGFMEEIEYLRAQGLARGGSLDNAVVIDQSGVLNPQGLRYENELIRHKVLDTLGDLKLAGVWIRGKFSLTRTGHEAHRLLLNAIFSDPSNFELIHPPAPSTLPHSRPESPSLAEAQALEAALAPVSEPWAASL